ncbi:MotA/TolQ/ExbB proton channel family protein [Frigidibacter sp. ROC022]|uniref:MotA/TolQ/ExbB proton channel family protein n=1 Tax=Frigidibacter sp. ROC022 TaxID=2971796 RepID=UPI00215A54B3|nr:MotA/TolQ/ExbB proton channel family protein [Frigidibacter sp. ROC022]MCR8723321.1 MotA/TolQ/ExbB proton channel family protein [Frigidibacter sp. ROC022]
MASLLGMIRDGGPIILLLLALSLLSLTLIVWKIIHLAPVLGGRDRRAQALEDWREGRREAALAELRSGRAPADRITAYAMESLSEGISGPLLDAELTRRGNEEMAQMSSSIRLLELIAMISPLLGLLGTVTGMIQSFQMLAAAEGSANASVLAGGIWQALLTTAAGLIVAIPAAVGASLLAGRVERAGLAMESAVGSLMLIEGGPARAASD